VIPYTVKISKRAKYARLRMSPHEGLVVVVPKGFDKKLVAEIVAGKEEWIRKVQKGFEARRAASLTLPDGWFPDSIELSAAGESWSVCYRTGESDTVRARQSGLGQLQLSGAVHDHVQCHEALEGWLRIRAKATLAPLLEALASSHGFSFAKVSFRRQKSRWGSCSSRGTVSLNVKLLFLPLPLVRYIMIHELCHTVHMNHSRKFWELVSRYDPDYLVHDREMSHAWRYVPNWAALSP
jgi:predicted metal-dependent hydrolase